MSQIWVALVLIGLGTVALRGAFLLTAHRSRSMSPQVARVLRMIPPAALAAIVGLQLADPDASTGLAARLLAAAVATAITWWRANMALALVVGMATVIVADLLL